MIIEKSSHKTIGLLLVRGTRQKIANEWLAKAYLLADAVFQNRTDGALVRLTTPIYPGETESDADKRLQGFIRDFVPT